jgi:hypothetical protein
VLPIVAKEVQVPEGSTHRTHIEGRLDRHEG